MKKKKGQPEVAASPPLPNETWMEVLKYLTVMNDQLNARLVCHDWNDMLLQGHKKLNHRVANAEQVHNKKLKRDAHLKAWKKRARKDDCKDGCARCCCVVGTAPLVACCSVPIVVASNSVY